MGKRAPSDEQPFRPLLDSALVQATMAQEATPLAGFPGEGNPANNATARVVDFHRPEPVSKADHPGRTHVKAESILTAYERQAKMILPVIEKFDHEKRILFTLTETQAIDRLVNSLATRVGAQVKVSHVFRALVALLLNAAGEVDKRAGEAGPLIRPSNANAQGLEHFENQIAAIIGTAIRDAGPIR